MMEVLSNNGDSYLKGKQIHNIIPINDADVPGVKKTETIIAYGKGSDVKSYDSNTEKGSIGMKMHQDVKYNYDIPFTSYPDGKKLGTPIPPPRLKKAVSQPIFLRRKQESFN